MKKETKKEVKKDPFLNCGEQIKKFVRALYKLLLLLSIGGGIVLVICGIADVVSGEIIFWVGLAVAVVLPIIIHISSLFLYGFGEIVENAEKQTAFTVTQKVNTSDEIPSL